MRTTLFRKAECTYYLSCGLAPCHLHCHFPVLEHHQGLLKTMNIKVSFKCQTLLCVKTGLHNKSQQSSLSWNDQNPAKYHSFFHLRCICTPGAWGSIRKFSNNLCLESKKKTFALKLTIKIMTFRHLWGHFQVQVKMFITCINMFLTVKIN